MISNKLSIFKDFLIKFPEINPFTRIFFDERENADFVISDISILPLIARFEKLSVPDLKAFSKT